MNSSQRLALDYFVRMGWSAAQSAGIVANLWAESKLNPATVGDGGQAYGIAQWHPDRQAHFPGLFGKPIHGSTLDEQLAFVHAELIDFEKSAGDALRRCTSASDAGACVSIKYERPGDAVGEATKRAALAESLFNGGTFGAAVSLPPSADTPPDVPATLPEKQPMGALELLRLFPLLETMIPQIAPLLGPKGQKFSGIAQVVVDTITKTAGTQSLGAAVEAMATDSTVKAAVQAAVITHPDIIDAMIIGEVGGGAAAARKADLDARAGPEGPFWKTSAVFWISMALLPLIYWYVGSSVVGGISIPDTWPWYAQLPLKMFGVMWDAGARVGLANLVVGLVLGGMCGVYYGVSVTQAKQAAQQTAESKT